MNSSNNSNCVAAAANYSASSAPLPSPSASQASNNYFSVRRHNSSTSMPQIHAQGPTSQPQSQQQSAQSQQTQGQQYGHDSYATVKEKDFCMIAEAAKRAQMAVLIRDMGEVAL